VDGRIPAITFRRQLHRGGVPVAPDLDRLIRIHECDNSVKFQEFARAVLRQDRQDLINARAETPVYANSPPSVPSRLVSRGSWEEEDARRRSVGAPSECGSSASRAQASVRAPYATEDYQPPTPSGASRSSRSTPNAPGFRPPSAPVSSRPASGSDAGARGGYPQGRGPGADPSVRHMKEPSVGGTPRRRSQPRSDIQNGVGGSASRGSTPPPQVRRGPADNNMADCLSWPESNGPSGREPGRGDARFGKRYVARAPARDILPQPDTPYDSGSGAQQQPPPNVYAAPFGTDADCMLRRPEDGGTAEYQPASAENPRARRF
jgi:hypothetical protein